MCTCLDTFRDREYEVPATSLPFASALRKTQFLKAKQYKMLNLIVMNE